MKKSIPGLIVLILFLSALPCYSQSQIGYVSDMLLLTFREGPGTSFPITKTLTSNTQVNILKDKNGYYKVQLENDEIGWVEKQYIIFTTPKTIKITQLEKQLQNFDDRMSKLQMINSSLEELVNSQKAEYSSKLNALETELNKEKNEKTLALKNFSESQKKYDNLIEKSENIKQVITENNELSEQN
ncbi:MAG: TIGR04211 family SH3 domain-containing protein, partial [Desulfobacteraceae bacterium]|nr:TIGR04211 family SH3 domain-containing protein [Desulfobacteraceae bacterium]